MRLAICGLVAVLAACGQHDPAVTTTPAVYAPTANDTRTGVLAEQHDAARTEERASRSRTRATTTRRPAVLSKAALHRPAALARIPTHTPPAGGCGPGKKPRAVMVTCWTPLVTQYPWPSLSKVWSVMACESQGDQNATGPATRYGRAHGLMQEMNGPYDPAANIARAWTMSRGGTDWSPWVCA